jgi:hypothetical protein
LTPNVIEQLFRHYESYALGGATTAWMGPIIFQIVSIIKSALLSGLNIAQRFDPNSAVLHYRFAVRLAAVIEKASLVPRNTSVQIVLRVEFENVMVAESTACDRFGFGNFLPHIFDDAFGGPDGSRSKSAVTVDR